MWKGQQTDNLIVDDKLRHLNFNVILPNSMSRTVSKRVKILNLHTEPLESQTLVIQVNFLSAEIDRISTK